MSTDRNTLEFVFPAGAGVIPDYAEPTGSLLRVSRRRGGDPKLLVTLQSDSQCFPQARG